MLQVLRRSQRWILWLRDLRDRRRLRVLPRLGRGARAAAAPGAGRGRRSATASSTSATSTACASARSHEYRRAPRRRLRPARPPRDYLDQIAAEPAGASVAILAERGRAPRAARRATTRSASTCARVPGGPAPDGRIDREAWTRARRARVRERRALRGRRSARTSSRAKVLAPDRRSRSRSPTPRCATLLRYRLEEVRVAYVAVDPQELPRQGRRSTTRRSRRCCATRPARASRRAYDDRKSEFDQPEQVRARHVLIRVRPRTAPTRRRPRPRRARRPSRRWRGSGRARPSRRSRRRSREDPGLEGRGRRPRLLPARPDGAGLRGGRVLAPARQG